jgi:hypothetical protein
VKRWEAFTSGCRGIGGHAIPWRVVASGSSAGWAGLKSAGGPLRITLPLGETTAPQSILGRST